VGHDRDTHDPLTEKVLGAGAGALDCPTDSIPGTNGGSSISVA
jgi:hypothetical protein